MAAGADPRATNDKGETALQVITRLRAEAEPFAAHDPQGFFKACFQAKLDYLRHSPVDDDRAVELSDADAGECS